MNDAAERLIKARRDAGYDKATEAAQAFGWTVSTYLSHENGSRGITTRAADRYAVAFGVTAAWILTGAREKRTYNRIPVLSVIDYTKSAIEHSRPLNREAAMEGDTKFISFEDDLPPDSVAIQLDSDSYWPAYQKFDLLVLGPKIEGAERILKICSGYDCLVLLKDQTLLIGTIESSPRENRVSILSPNKPPILNELPLWAAKIIWIKRDHKKSIYG